MSINKFGNFNTMNIQELQNEQYRLTYELKQVEKSFDKSGLYIQYDSIRNELHNRLGNDAPVADIDYDLYETYVHLYQSENGEKPGYNSTVNDALAYLEMR